MAATSKKNKNVNRCGRSALKLPIVVQSANITNVVVLALLIPERLKIKYLFASLGVVSVFAGALLVNAMTIDSSLGWSANFSNLVENHLIKYDAFSEELKVGIFSDQEGKNKGDRRLVKNIPPDLKPGELFVIREGKVFVYKTKIVMI